MRHHVTGYNFAVARISHAGRLLKCKVVIIKETKSRLGTFMRISLIQLVTLVMLSLAMSACGKRPQVVTGIQVQSSTVNSDVMLALKADLNLGNMMFPSVTLPILHPKGQTPIGSVELLPVLGGKNQIKISVNVSSLADIQAVQATLPNGNAIPLIAANPTIIIPLGAGAKLYLTVGANAVALGVAVPIKTFDSIGSRLGSINLFPMFAFDKVVGAAGMFTGLQAGQNGFALIADVTQYVNLQDIFVPQRAADIAKMALSQDEQVVKLKYEEHIPAKEKEDKLNVMILNLNSKSKRLELRK